MSDAIKVTRKDLGIVNGLQTWEVINADTSEVIGYDQTAVEGEYNAN
jgi:hypothetical protein